MKALSLLFFLLGVLPSLAFTSEDADTIMDSFNKAFFVRANSTSGHYANKQTDRGEVTGTTYFWGQAEEIEGILDAYDRTGNPDYKDKITKLLQGFVEQNGADWSDNKYNDDCMWACIAFSRAYLAIGSSKFRTIAKSNFDMVYARAWDDHLGGGMWWTTDNNTKNACINGPGAIAAYLLYKCTGQEAYLAKAKAMYDWERDKLFEPDTGKVYDALNDKGVLNKWSSTYNQGTFVGASNYLGKVEDATRAASYTMNEMGNEGPGEYRIMPTYKISDNNSGFNGIGIRWIAKFMMDNKLQDLYLKWLQANANAAWNVRRTQDNLSWCQWHDQTPADTLLHSWDCSSSVVALQVVPPDSLDATPQAPPENQSESTNQPPPLDQSPATNQAMP